MKRNCLFFVFLCIGLPLFSQYKVRFIVKEMTEIKHDSIYITGTLNNWDSVGNMNYRLSPYGPGVKSILITLPRGPYQYKFTRGSWSSVEKMWYGNEQSNRQLLITRDTTIADSIQAWRDEFLVDKRLTLNKAQNDTNRVRILAGMANAYAFFADWYNSDSALAYAQQTLQMLEKIKSSKDLKSWTKTEYTGGVIYIQETTAEILHSLGNYPKALEIRLENLKLAEDKKDIRLVLDALNKITIDYLSMKDYYRVLQYCKRMMSMLQSVSGKEELNEYIQWYPGYTMSDAYYNLNVLDSAMQYALGAYNFGINRNNELLKAYSTEMLGDIYSKKEDPELAFSYYNISIPLSVKYYLYQMVARSQQGIAKLFQKKGQIDSALYYARQSLSTLQNNSAGLQSSGENINGYIADISPLIAELYKSNHQLDSAFKYLQLSVDLKEHLYNVEKVRQFQNLTFNENARQQQQEQKSRDAREKFETRVKVYSLIIGMAAMLFLAFFLYRNNKRKQKLNNMLQTQKEEIQRTLTELKSTQKQLIQREKMASIGELTAGIAHEIQNPLNFVNNFSEVSADLLGEMEHEIEAGNKAELKLLAGDIKQNLQKISHHGKRADAIIKGMLHHSRNSNGLMELTDINALADEYLRLSYHGLRAKNKSFNATMVTSFDENLPKIKSIPQDIGRVLLNLFTNAFYSVAEKKRLKGEVIGPEGKPYEPTVTVTTKKLMDKVMIKVRDNGLGIPQKVIEKIYQPFFTTKPTGEGTGLGLSLSYDIITKGHGGEIKVETKEGEYAEFIIHLPL